MWYDMSAMIWHDMIWDDIVWNNRIRLKNDMMQELSKWYQISSYDEYFTMISNSTKTKLYIDIKLHPAL